MRTLTALPLALALILASGCALHKARTAADEGRYDEALARYRLILRKDPGNLQAKIGYRKTAPLAAEAHLAKAKAALKLHRDEEVRKEVAAAVVLDPANAVAVDWMARLEEAAARQREAENDEDSVDRARAAAGQKEALPINPRSLEGMDLNFTRKTSLKEIFQQLSRNSGVNIILHGSASAQDPSVSVDLRGLTFQRVLDTLMLQSDLFYKVLDPNTIMVFKKTPQNLQDYENKLIQTFYLSNADVDNVRQIFNAIMPQMRVFIDKRLNAITVQAKASDLAIAQRIVGQLDKAKAEVVVYLELVEVSDTASQIVGLLPTLNPMDTTAPGLYRLAAITTDPGPGGASQSPGGVRISKAQLNFLFAPLALDLLKSNGEGKLLASPNVRVVSGETGEVNIGQKISTTQSSLGGLGTAATAALPNVPTAPGAAGALSSLGGALTSQTQYSYEDVGVKIKVKPRVHFNGDITIDLESEVKTVVAGSTPGRPDLGQRIIKTSARLRDGETAVFGGLLKEDETKSLQGLWGLTDLPILGSLFGHTNGTKSRTDVLLTLRAVIVRKPDLVQADFEPFDPDQGQGATKPFAPKPPKKPLPPGLADGTEAAPPRSGPGPDGHGKPEPQGTPATAAAEDAPLVLFLSPLSADAAKGAPVTLTLFASGAQDVTSGTLTLKVDPRLKVVSVAPGDFLTLEGGTLDQGPPKDGLVTLAFKRPKGAADSGTFAVLQLEAVDTGKAAVLVQDGRFLVGANPITVRYVNALVTVR